METLAVIGALWTCVVGRLSGAVWFVAKMHASFFLLRTRSSMQYERSILSTHPYGPVYVRTVATRNMRDNCIEFDYFELERRITRRYVFTRKRIVPTTNAVQIRLLSTISNTLTAYVVPGPCQLKIDFVRRDFSIPIVRSKRVYSCPLHR